MPVKLLSTDAFRAAAKNGAKPEGMVVRVSSSEPQTVDGSRTERFVFSDDSVDLAGDEIKQDGWELDDFNSNPVALFSHASWEPPIGRASNVGVKGNKLLGDIEFASADVYPFADTIYRLVKARFLKAVSVGFMPLEYEFTKDKDRPFSMVFVRQKLLEISLCSVPCNPNALVEARAMGIDTEPLREWASKVLDTGGSVLVPRDLLEETFRQAKTPRAVRQKYLAKAETADWKVGAARDLALDESETTWDGPAASKRMLDAAGFDGESPDAAKAARGFLIHDAANPSLRSSYKLPFADIVAGALKAVEAGVSAAASRLPQTDVPQAARDEARTVLDGYEKKFADEDAAEQAAGGKTITPAPKEKSGRRISSANEALLRKAMDHHESATKCIKDVLDSNALVEPDDGNDDGNAPEVIVPLTEDAKRAARLLEAKALKASVKAA